VGFYGTVLLRQFLHDHRASRAEARRYGVVAAARTSHKLLLEFGPAELFDSLLIRPLAMGVATRWLGRGAGVVVGKIAADVTFYLPVIASYEWQRWHDERPRDPRA
jgi:hypothetical protein